MRCLGFMSGVLLLALISCNKKSGDSNQGLDIPNDRVAIDTSSAEIQGPGSNDATESGSYALSASCANKDFSLRITHSGELKTLRLDQLDKCEDLVKVLNGITLPNGKSQESLKGGPSIAANCVEGKFDLRASQAENTTSTVSVFGLNSQFCKELRNLVNAAQL